MVSFKLNVNMMSVIMLIFDMMGVITMSVIWMSIIMLNINMISAIMSSVVMLCQHNKYCCDECCYVVSLGSLFLRYVSFC